VVPPDDRQRNFAPQRDLFPAEQGLAEDAAFDEVEVLLLLQDPVGPSSERFPGLRGKAECRSSHGIRSRRVLQLVAAAWANWWK
jgi:hypothetical protein